MSATEFAVRQEDDVVPSRTLVKVGLVSVVIGAVGVFFSGVILVAATGALRHVVPARPAPREISGVAQTPIWGSRTGEDRLEGQRRALDGWGWADRKAGIATIPIDRAMDMVVQESR